MKVCLSADIDNLTGGTDTNCIQMLSVFFNLGRLFFKVNTNEDDQIV